VGTVKTGKVVAPAQASAPDWLRLTAVVLSVLGILVAGYMTWAELTDNETVCIDAGAIDCAAVQDSAYAKTFGVSVALLGLVGYVAILGVLALEDQLQLLAAYGRTLVLGFASFGVIFQTYLTYVEAAVLEKWCQWCVISYFLITALLIVGALRLRSFFKLLRS
jgi:uncharacterized membrane protein